MTKYTTENDKGLLARLRRNIQHIAPKEVEMLSNSRDNTLTAAAFIELLCLVKCAMLSINKGLQNAGSSNILLFNN